MGKKWTHNAAQSIVEAGRTISYVETLNPSKADKLHLSMKENDKKLFMREFEQIIRFAIPRLKLKRVKLAFDVTEDLTWMKSSHNLRASAYHKHLPTWQYLNVSVVDPYFVPVMSIPYTALDNLDNLVMDLLNYIRTLPISVDLILFDRGFYHARLIDYLNGENKKDSWPYLILVSNTKRTREYMDQTKYFRYFNHEFRSHRYEKNWKPSTTIVTRRINEKICFCYATNQKPSLYLLFEYKKRWNIETGFRIHDEAGIKSKSRNPLIRFFYHLVGMLLILLWRLQNTVDYIVFKRFLKILESTYADIQIQIIPKYPPPL